MNRHQLSLRHSLNPKQRGEIRDHIHFLIIRKLRRKVANQTIIDLLFFRFSKLVWTPPLPLHYDQFVEIHRCLLLVTTSSGSVQLRTGCGISYFKPSPQKVRDSPNTVLFKLPHVPMIGFSVTIQFHCRFDASFSRLEEIGEEASIKIS